MKSWMLTSNFSEGASLNDTQIEIIALFCHMPSCLKKNELRKEFPYGLSKLPLTFPFSLIGDCILDKAHHHANPLRKVLGRKYS